MSKCIINYVTKNRIKGQERLAHSLKELKFDGDFLPFNNSNLNCPKHLDVPYAFKPYSMMEARKIGYKQIVWVDASFWAIKPLDYLFKCLRTYGNVFQNSSYKLGMWCSDKALEKFNITREKAFEITLYSAGLTGIDLNFPNSIHFLDKWFEYANDGVSFQGSWKNKNLCVSKDKRVKGHRHDMSVASFIAYDLKMKIFPNNTFFSYYEWYDKYKNDLNYNTDNVCFLAQGM